MAAETVEQSDQHTAPISHPTRRGFIVDAIRRFGELPIPSPFTHFDAHTLVDTSEPMKVKDLFLRNPVL